MTYDDDFLFIPTLLINLTFVCSLDLIPTLFINFKFYIGFALCIGTKLTLFHLN